MRKVVLPRVCRGWVIALAIPVLAATSLEAQVRPGDSTKVGRDSAAAQTQKINAQNSARFNSSHVTRHLSLAASIGP